MDEPHTNNGFDLEGFLSYLNLLAGYHLPREFRRYVSPSDLVQQTLLEARKDSGGRERTRAQTAAWLRTILICNVRDAIRKYSKYPEKSLYDLDASSSRLEAWITADHTPPEEQAMRNEQLEVLARELEKLEHDEKEAIMLRFFQGKRNREIAEVLGKNAGTVSRLIQNGVRKLGERLRAGTDA